MDFSPCRSGRYGSNSSIMVYVILYGDSGLYCDINSLENSFKKLFEDKVMRCLFLADPVK